MLKILGLKIASHFLDEFGNLASEEAKKAKDSSERFAGEVWSRIAKSAKELVDEKLEKEKKGW